MKLNIEGFQQLDIEAETVGKIAALCHRVIPGVANNHDAESVANVILEKALDAALEVLNHPSDWELANLKFTLAKAPANPAAEEETPQGKIEPVTLTVTLTGRQAAAYRRAVKYDKLTEQQAAEVALADYVRAFTDMEHEWRSNAARRRAGIPEPVLVPDEFAERLADGILDRMEAKGAIPTLAAR